MKVIGLQLDIDWENKPANYEKVEALLSRESDLKGALVVLPEMFATGFSMNVESIREEPGGPTERWLGEISRRYEICLLAGVVHPGANGKGLNQAVVFGPDGEPLLRYSKMHPFSYGKETDYYDRGNEVKSFDYLGFRISPFICYDLRFPEAFREASRRGTDLFLVIANWPVMREWHWVRLLEARAIENLAYTVGVNRCGADPNLKYPGRSLIVDPLGKILADAGPGEGAISAELELERVRDWQATFPALGDTHPKYG